MAAGREAPQSERPRRRRHQRRWRRKPRGADADPGGNAGLARHPRAHSHPRAARRSPAFQLRLQLHVPLHTSAHRHNGRLVQVQTSLPTVQCVRKKIIFLSIYYTAVNTASLRPPQCVSKDAGYTHLLAFVHWSFTCFYYLAVLLPNLNIPTVHLSFVTQNVQEVHLLTKIQNFVII
jgi:hypothetical protein